ncbi:MAG: hypothetical protein WCH31_06620 [Actinomycetes bacterium]
MPAVKLRSWKAWYRLAQEVLGYQHEESVEYANLRSVEDGNRDASDPDPPRAASSRAET